MFNCAEGRIFNSPGVTRYPLHSTHSAWIKALPMVQTSTLILSTHQLISTNRKVVGIKFIVFLPALFLVKLLAGDIVNGGFKGQPAITIFSGKV